MSCKTCHLVGDKEDRSESTRAKLFHHLVLHLHLLKKKIHFFSFLLSDILLLFHKYPKQYCLVILMTCLIDGLGVNESWRGWHFPCCRLETALVRMSHGTTKSTFTSPHSSFVFKLTSTHMY